MNQARQRDILFLALAGAQACWIYTTLLLLDVKAVEGDLPLLGIMSFYPLAFVLGRALRRLPWGEIRLFVLSWVLWFLFFLGLAKHYAAPFGNPFEPAWIHSFSGGLFQVSYLSTQQLTLACSVLLWWLGSRLLRLRLDFATSLTEFQFGVAILLILFFFESQWDLDLPGLVPLTMAFFVFSFAGTAITHAREGAGWLSGPFRSRWMSLLIFTLVIVLMGGMIIVALVKPDILKLILSLLSMGWTFFWDLLFRVLSFLASLFSSDQPAPLPAMPAMPAPPPESPSWVKLFRLPEWVRRVGSVVMVCIWMILILAAIWSVSSQIIRWLRQRLEGMSEVEVEPMSGAFLDDLLYLFKWLFLLAGRFFHFVLRPFRRKRKIPAVSAEISSIRTIYRRMLDWAATLGCPRDVTLTPLEYLKVLSDRIPEAGHEVSIITHQYVLVRYGDHQPTRDTLRQVKATWERLREVKPAVPGGS
ncbi:MAG: DUF4129 domain-containing protein [Desulfobacterota bacterium]|nr:DUF4129 domain-containing protein [Thermodesulfobacteriota bacterium]